MNLRGVCGLNSRRPNDCSAWRVVKLIWVKMRKILSLLVALGLAGLGPLPVSACAVMHAQASECATPQTKTECEHMGMEHAEKLPVSVSHSGGTCCRVSEAPTPETQNRAGSFAVATPPALTSGTVVATQPVECAWSPQIAKDSSPPPLQSLLCIFLI